MSKAKDRCGYVRPQPNKGAKPDPKVTAWQDAQAAFDDADEALEQACEASGLYAGKDVPTPPVEQAAHLSARDRLLSTPAPNGVALAHKFAVLVHAYTPLEGDLRKPEERQWVIEHGDDGDKAALAVYLDALALSGATATVPVTPIQIGPDEHTRRVIELDALRKRLDDAHSDDNATEAESEALAAQVHAAETELRVIPCTSQRSAALKLAAYAEGLEKGERLDDAAVLHQVLAYLRGESGRPATGAQVAATDFEPWTRDESGVPTPERWVGAWDPHGVSLRFAYETLLRSKSELVAMAHQLGGTQPDGGQFYALAQRFQQTEEFLSGWLAMIRAADGRLLIAAHAANSEAGNDLGDGDEH